MCVCVCMCVCNIEQTITVVDGGYQVWWWFESEVGKTCGCGREMIALQSANAAIDLWEGERGI